MATKKMMEAVLTHLSNVWPKKINSSIVDTYYEILKGFSDDDLFEAALKYVDSENEYFPTPNKLKKCIPFKNINNQTLADFHLTDYKMRCQILGCFKTDICIREPLSDPTSIYKCRDCYSGLTLEQRNQRMRDIMHIIKDKNYKPKWVDSSHV